MMVSFGSPGSEAAPASSLIQIGCSIRNNITRSIQLFLMSFLSFPTTHWEPWRRTQHGPVQSCFSADSSQMHIWLLQASYWPHLVAVAFFFSPPNSARSVRSTLHWLWPPAAVGCEPMCTSEVRGTKQQCKHDSTRRSLCCHVNLNCVISCRHAHHTSFHAQVSVYMIDSRPHSSMKTCSKKHDIQCVVL